MSNSTAGQSVLEALVCACLLVTVLTVAIPAVYLSYVKLWLHHFLYEAAVCENLVPHPSDCKEKFSKSMRAVAPIGSIRELHVKNLFGRTEALARYSISNKISIDDSLRIVVAGAEL